MSDTRLSSSLRSVRQGLDPDSRRAALVERMRYRPWAPTVCERCNGNGALADVEYMTGRSAKPTACPSCAGTGSPLQARLELAAYCGDEAARAVAGWEFDALTNSVDLSRWVSGLSRWSDLHESAPGWVLVRAAVAAARVALPKYMADAHGLGINAHGRLYEIDPGEWTSRAALNEAMLPVVLAPLRAIEAAEAWLAETPDEARWTAFHTAYVEAGHLAWLPPPCSTARVERILDAILAAAHLAGEAPVRSAICSALTSWALETPA